MEKMLGTICGVAFLLGLTPFVAFFAIRWVLGIDHDGQSLPTAEPSSKPAPSKP
jgi:hypothetical protein